MIRALFRGGLSVKRILLAVALFATSAIPAGAKEIKIHGYVTNVVSSTQFEIEDYRITRDVSLVLELEKQEGDESLQFHPEDIRVGTELEIKGEYDEATSELHAKSIKVVLDDYRKIKRTALIERQPLLTRTSGGWEGTFFADGQNIRVESSTKVFFKPNKSESKALKQQTKSDKKNTGHIEQGSDAGASSDLHLLESLDQIGPNTFMTYEGLRQPDGSIAASRLEFVRNEIEKGESRLWRELEPKVKESGLTSGKPGELKIRTIGKFKLLPNKDVQAYVQQLGDRLVPQFQKEMPGGEADKIHFRFYVVDEKQPNAFALSNGVVVIHSAMFGIVENEAQLAAVIGHEITHTIEKHVWRELQYHKKKLIALRIGGAVAAGMGAYGIRDITTLVEAAVRNGYSRSLENQADREGLQNMFAAGYDPREAPNVWKQMTRKLGDQPTNFFWSNHDSHTARRSYLMAELRNNYSGADFSNLKKDSDEFDKIAAAARAASKNKPKLKVKY
jgi:Zn-dependent protease with chaperone function